MSKYWVNLGREPDEEQPNEEREAALELEKLANTLTGEIPQLVFRSPDLDEAKDVYNKAVGIVKKHLGEDYDPIKYGLSITALPECLKCGYVGGFSAEYCPVCGAGLTAKLTSPSSE